MTTHALSRRNPPWRFLVWSGGLALLLLPLVAMQFTGEVAWDALDFAVFAGMLVAAGALGELVLWLVRSRRERLIGLLAVAALFIATWATLALDVL